MSQQSIKIFNTTVSQSTLVDAGSNEVPIYNASSLQNIPIQSLEGIQDQDILYYNLGSNQFNYGPVSSSSTGYTGATGPTGNGYIDGTVWGQYNIWDDTTNSYTGVSDQIILGRNAGQNSQGTYSVAIGRLAGQTSQGRESVAIGTNAGSYSQGTGTVAIGGKSGQTSQGNFSTSIGYLAGSISQGIYSIALGYLAGQTSQSLNSVAIGHQAGRGTQGGAAVAIGSSAGQTAQGGSCVAVGVLAGASTQGAKSIAIGVGSGSLDQQTLCIAIGEAAGNNDQGTGSIAIGSYAGGIQQGTGSIAIGNQSARASQGHNSISVGSLSGQTSQGNGCIAIGCTSGQAYQNANCIAIGTNAGQNTQGTGSIAIGYNAGVNSQLANSICINASGVEINPTEAGFYVSPVRTIANPALNVLSLTSDEVVINSSKTFVIDHPIYNNRYLVHACVEGPESGVYYRGRSFIEKKGVVVKLPEYASKIASDFTIQLTPLLPRATTGLTDTSIPLLATNGVENGEFYVVSNIPCEFYWHVYGKRVDIITEPLKTDVELLGNGPYKWVK